jgi:C3HC zinc finger-like/Rsm1-like
MSTTADNAGDLTRNQGMDADRADTAAPHDDELAAIETTTNDAALLQLQLQLDQMVAPSPTRTARLQQRCAEYRTRLQTFSVANYFAMPVEISPIACAVAGWEIQQSRKTTQPKSTVLMCSSCEAVVAILIPASLSLTSKKALTAHYAEQLYKTHKDHCLRRKEAEYLFRDPKCVPAPLARVLPSSALELIEQESSMFLLPLIQMRMDTLCPLIQALQTPLHLPSGFLSYLSDTDGTAATKTLPNRLLEQLQQETGIEGQNSEAPFEKNVEETAISLTLTGWELQPADTAEASLCCSFCSVRQSLVKISPVADTDSPATKRQRLPSPSRWNQPLEAHRYYCPWICVCFQSTKPLWQVLADRLLARPDLSSVDQDWSHMHKLLKAGISSKRIKSSSKPATPH